MNFDTSQLLHRLSISIRHQSISEKDDKITKWTLNVLPILFTRFDLVSTSCGIGSSMYLCIFFISLAILTTSRSYKASFSSISLVSSIRVDA